MKESRDKLISSILLSISMLLVIIWMYNYYASLIDIEGDKVFNIRNLVLSLEANIDLLIILYVFLCLQLAGISEFKQRQDYFLVALISLIFTPLGLLFIKKEKNNDDS